jgi:hypothetical protein
VSYGGLQDGEVGVEAKDTKGNVYEGTFPPAGEAS